jgi:hypothetical protein
LGQVLACDRVLAEFRLVDYALVDFARFIRHLAESEDGGERFDDGLAVFLEIGMLFGREEVDLAGEAGFVGVETGALRAGFAP